MYVCTTEPNKRLLHSFNYLNRTKDLVRRSLHSSNKRLIKSLGT